MEQEKKYDLEERTFKFAQRIRKFVPKLKYTTANKEDRKQLVRSSGSVAANYIEANENLGSNDLKMHIKISRKEAKESDLWLRLLDVEDDKLIETERGELVNEAKELTKIFGAIYRKLELKK
ncbi:MAG: four helix bundle protein [Bacteroidia bacterium]